MSKAPVNLRHIEKHYGRPTGARSRKSLRLKDLAPVSWLGFTAGIRHYARERKDVFRDVSGCFLGAIRRKSLIENGLAHGNLGVLCEIAAGKRQLFRHGESR